VPQREPYSAGLPAPIAELREDLDALLRFAENLQERCYRLSVWAWTLVTAILVLGPFVVGCSRLLGLNELHYSAVLYLFFAALDLLLGVAVLRLRLHLRRESRMLYDAVRILHEVGSTQFTQMTELQRQLFQFRLARLDYGSRGKFRWFL